MAAECRAGAVIRMLVVAHRVPCRQSVRHSSSSPRGCLAVTPFPGLPKWGMYRILGAEPALPEPQNCIKRRACAPGQRRAEPLSFLVSKSEECIVEPPLSEPQRLQQRRTCAPTCAAISCSVELLLSDLQHSGLRR